MRVRALVPIAALLASSFSSAPLPAESRRLYPPPIDADAICRPFLEAEFSQDDYAASAPAVKAQRGGSLGRLYNAPVAPPPPVVRPSAPPAPRAGDAVSAPLLEHRAQLPEAQVRSAPVAPPVIISGTPVTQDARRHAPGIVPPPGIVRAPGRPENRERYDGEEVAAVQAVAEAPVSTFGVDVDTGSYANVRRMLVNGSLPPQAAVRTEEMLNYFRYDYPRPADRSKPFSVTTDVTRTPWNDSTRLLRIGLRGYDLPSAQRPAANVVFLVDVSGSMMSPDKLPLVKCSLALMAERLNPRDRVAIAVYAGASGLVLEPTSSKQAVLNVLGRLQAGGSTAGAAGLALAYDTARRAMIPGGINRIVLATDGDFNVGVTDTEALIDMVEREREAGITLTTLGFGTGNYNEAMMEQIANHGNGNYAYIDSAREAHKVLDQELSSTLFTIAKDTKIQVEFNPAYVSEYRLIGYENRALREEDFDNDAVDAGDIGAGHQVTALYEIVPAGSAGWRPDRRYPANRAAADGAANGELAWLKLRYKLPGQERSRLIEQSVAASLVARARAPEGDVAFIAAVAGFGQKLRGDPYLNGFGFADARRLAARGDDGSWWRGEFVRLTELAERRQMASLD